MPRYSTSLDAIMGSLHDWIFTTNNDYFSFWKGKHLYIYKPKDVNGEFKNPKDMIDVYLLKFDGNLEYLTGNLSTFEIEYEKVRQSNILELESLIYLNAYDSKTIYSRRLALNDDLYEFTKDILGFIIKHDVKYLKIKKLIEEYESESGKKFVM